MEVKIIFKDGTEITRTFTDAQEHALFVDIVNPEEWIENAIYQKARKIIDEKLQYNGIDLNKTQEEKEEIFLSLNLPKAKDLVEEYE